eukprot:5122118-Amphidinium_carterae.1
MNEIHLLLSAERFLICATRWNQPLLKATASLATMNNNELRIIIIIIIIIINKAVTFKLEPLANNSPNLDSGDGLCFPRNLMLVLTVSVGSVVLIRSGGHQVKSTKRQFKSYI